MPEEDNLDRKVRKLAVDHAETRWLALRLDDDVKELREDLRAVKATQQAHTERFDSIDGHLQEHTAQFDSINSQLRSLTQMVGQVLERLPEQPRED
jgi:chromosome segregation ATPase